MKTQYLEELINSHNIHKDVISQMLSMMEDQDNKIKSLEETIYNLTSGMSELYHRLTQLERE